MIDEKLELVGVREMSDLELEHIAGGAAKPAAGGGGDSDSDSDSDSSSNDDSSSGGGGGSGRNGHTIVIL